MHKEHRIPSDVVGLVVGEPVVGERVVGVRVGMSELNSVRLVGASVGNGVGAGVPVTAGCACAHASVCNYTVISKIRYHQRS